MKIVVLLVATWWALLAGARAQDEPAPQPQFLQAVPPHCDADAAVWSNPTAPGGAPYADQATNGWKQTQGARTQTWSCKVKNRLLVLRFYTTHPVHACAAVDNVFVSAWVNGIKLLSREDAGEAPECLGGDALKTVTMQVDGSVQICRISWNAPYAERPTFRCARLTTWDIRQRGRDPKYVAPSSVTPWAYDLHYGDPKFCARYTSRLTLVPWHSLMASDPAFAELSIPGTEDWMNAYVGFDYLYDEHGKVKENKDGDPIEDTKPPRTAEFDADNDGIVDIVTLDNTRKKEGPVMAELRWKKIGAQGKPFVAGEIISGTGGPGILKSDTYAGSYIAQLVRPIRIDGRTYFYARRHQAYDSEDGGEDLFAIQIDEKSVLRGLIELHPDGATTLTCGWGPRFRPEEAL